jgi:glyoxylase-like metal-dependent hydrolase (beta-lactamase superfamily II)
VDFIFRKVHFWASSTGIRHAQPESDWKFINSIDNLLLIYPEDTIVLPGHGLDTTIGTERPHLQEWVERGW